MLPYINTPFLYLANIIGASPDELKLIGSFLLSYPLAGVLKRIPDSRPWQKNSYIIAVSLFYLVGLFDLWDGLRTLFISSAGAYAIATFIQGPFMPWIAFVFLMGHMSVNHIHRMYVNDPGLVDITGAQMVLIMKLSAFCWNVHDGALSEAALTDLQKERALRKLPPLLDFAGYVLFFPSLFAGPAFDYADYARYISTTMFDSPTNSDQQVKPPTRKLRRIPRSGTPATYKAIQGLIWIFLFVKFSAKYYPTYYASNEYMKYGFFRRVFQLYMLGITTRMKYYGVWSLTEGSCILSGIGFNGLDPKSKRWRWDRLRNVKPMHIELAQNSHDFLGYWNINTNLWLRNYVYLRVTPKGKKPGFAASMATFVTSAFWHGFYPGYYFAFILAAFIQTVAKEARRLFRPFFMSSDGKVPLSTKRYYDIATFLITQLAFAFTVAPFVLLTLSTILLVWSRVYFYAIIGVALCLGFFNSPGKAYLAKHLKARVQKSTVAQEGSKHM